MTESTEPIDLKDLLKFAGASLKKVSEVTCSSLAGDGSGRSYYRVALTGAPIKSAVLLFTPPGVGPKLAGDTSFTQEQAFAELCKFFPRVGIPTPQFYGYEPDKHWILTEDVGDIALYRFFKVGSNKSDHELVERLSDKIGSNVIVDLFKKSVELIKTAQAIPEDKKIIAFRRFLAFENYRNEIQEFSDFYAEPRGLKPSAAKEVAKVYDAICETLMSFPKALSFFDFNAHNLFVDPEGELRVLDFQDSCLVTPARDIVSLINDRGMDELLGQERHSEILRYFIKTMSVGKEFESCYNFTLLHWDLRVAGRFVKLNQKFNTDKYEQWIPSTLRRLGRTLKRCEKEVHGLSTLLEIAHDLSAEVREGFQDPWGYPK